MTTTTGQANTLTPSARKLDGDITILPGLGGWFENDRVLTRHTAVCNPPSGCLHLTTNACCGGTHGCMWRCMARFRPQHSCCCQAHTVYFAPLCRTCTPASCSAACILSKAPDDKWDSCTSTCRCRNNIHVCVCCCARAVTARLSHMQTKLANCTLV